MNEQIKKEDQLFEETSTETYARFAQGVFNVVRVIHQELQTIAEEIERCHASGVSRRMVFRVA